MAETIPPSLLLVLSNFPDTDVARSIGREMVSNDLAACVNLVPKVESIYKWEGNLESNDEVLAIFKVSSERYSDFKKTLSKKHPYDVPEIVALRGDDVNAGYLEWALGKGKRFE